MKHINYLIIILFMGSFITGCTSQQENKSENNLTKNGGINIENKNESNLLDTGININSGNSISNTGESKINNEKELGIEEIKWNTEINNDGLNKNGPDIPTEIIKEIEDKTKDGNGQIWFEKKYNLPGGKDTFLGGNITLENGIIKDIQIKTDTKGKINFFEGIKSKIIGKNIKGLQIDSVSGASLSTKSFNEILKEINEKFK